MTRTPDTGSTISDAVARTELDWQKADRELNDGEIWSIVRISSKSKLDGESLANWLQERGYKASLAEQLVKKVSCARDGTLLHPDWYKLEVEAENLMLKSKATERRATELFETSNAITRKVEMELIPQLEKVKQEKLEADKVAKMWGWVRFGGTMEAFSRASGAVQSAEDMVQAARQDAAEAGAGAALLRQAAALEADRAAQLRGEAGRGRTARELRERGSLLGRAEQVLAKAEAALTSDGPAAGQRALAGARELWAALGVRPDRRASRGSLAGRLHALVTAGEEAAGRRAEKEAPSAASSAALGLAAVAALAASAAYYHYAILGAGHD